MYIVKVGVGVAMCFVGGWQLASLLGSGEDSGESEGWFSREALEWRDSCTETAQREWPSDFVSQHQYNAGILKLRQQGCNPRSAPAGLIPSVTDSASDWAAEDEWKDEIAEQYADEDWPE